MAELPFSSTECELLLEALNQELTTIKNQLAILTHNLDVKIKVPSLPLHHHHPTPPPSSHSPLPPGSSPLQAPPSCIDNSPPIIPTPSTIKSKQKKEHTNPVLSQPPEVPASHLLQVVDDREKERRQARRRYLTLMRAHIEKQLKELTKKESWFKKKKERRERKEKAARLQLKPVRYRSSGADDRKYLDHLHKSCYYQIVHVEHNLKKAGKLKTSSDVESFWDTMLSPIKTQPELPAMTYRCSRKGMDREGEEDKGNEGECTDSWAITALPPQHNKYPNEISPSTITSSASTSTAIKFIPHMMPDMVPIKEILDSDKDDRMLELKTSVNRFHDTTRYHREIRAQTFSIYQRARANEIAMRSLLPRIQSMERPCFTLVSSPLPSIPPSPPLSSPPPQHKHDHKHEYTQAHSKKTESKFNRLQLKGKIKKMKHVGYCHQELTKLESTPAKCDVPPPFQSGTESSSKSITVSLTMTDLLKASPAVREITKKNSKWSNYLLAGT